MSRLVVIAGVLAATSAHAQPVPAQPSDMPEQAIGGSIGFAGGGRVTAGGLRISGHYLYQLTSSDWFDGTAAFTFGGGDAACFRDRSDALVCDHGLVDGFAAEVSANVRRFFAGNGQYWPYAKVGIGAAIVRFASDDVTGFALPLHGGAGLRIGVADGIAIAAEAMLDIGIGRFNRGLGGEPQLGGSVMVGVEFGL